MVELSAEQVAFIQSDVRQKGIVNEALRDDLVDHICCLLEQKEVLHDFEKSYQEVLACFVRNELREIQEETDLLLTHFNYYTMKNILIRSGFTAGLLIVIGSILKILHLPGAAVALILATIIFSFVFLPIFFVVESAKKNQLGQKFVLALGSLFGILFCLAAAFKVQHWPGATLLWRLALGELILLFLPVYFFVQYKQVEARNTTIVTSVMILIMGGMLFMLTNLRSSVRMDDAKERAFNSLKALADQPVSQKISDSKDSLKLQVHERIDAVKGLLLDAVSNAEGKKFDELLVFRFYADNYALVDAALFPNKKCAPQLNDLFTCLKQFNESFPGTFNGKSVYFNGDTLSWLDYMFRDMSIGQVLTELNLLKLKVSNV